MAKSFVTKILKLFFAKHGIVHQRTSPYTPEQNGVAERLNRTLIERVRCMLVDSNLSNLFWAEALSTAAYLLNRVPCRQQTITPEEYWTGKRPNLGALRTFGCKALAHIPKEKRRKLDIKSTVCIMLGYSDNTKTYRLYDPHAKKIITSRDVIFLENEIFNKDFTNTNQILSPTGGIEQREISGIKCGDLSSIIFFETPNLTGDVAEADSVAKNIAGGDKTVAGNVVEQNEIADVNVVVEMNDVAGSVNDEAADADEYNSAEESVLEITNENARSFDDSSSDPTYVPNIIVEPPQVLRQSERLTQRHNLCVNVVPGSDPETVAEALSTQDAEEWLKSMKAEMKSLEINDTWDLVDLPQGKKAIRSKWVFKTKRDECGNIARFKARLVIKGFTQRQGIDYFETFSPVVKYTSIRVLLAIAAKFNLNVRQMDAVTAFLNGDLKEEIYMCQPEGFDDGSKRVCKLNKSLYGLKQSAVFGMKNSITFYWHLV